MPLDGSGLAESVLPIVQALGARSGVRVTLLHVLERDAPEAVHGEPHLTAGPEAERYLQEIAKRLANDGIAVEYHAHEEPEGDIARSIAGHASDENADLTVLCTHGSGRMRERLFGSIAQKVLVRGTTPVLLARASPDGSKHPFAPHTVLVALDGTAGAEAALPAASEIARILDARLHLVMVVATQDSLRSDEASATLLPWSTRAALDLAEEGACSYLDEIAAKLRHDALTVTVEVRRGDAASALVSEATEPGVGLVVVATHGRAGLQAIWAGSVVARLLQRTTAPVLLLRTIEH